MPRSPDQASLKTAEFIAYLAVLAGLFIAAPVTKAGSNANDVFRANQVWLYAAIVTVKYMISRGLAKSVSCDATTEGRYGLTRRAAVTRWLPRWRRCVGRPRQRMCPP